MASKIYPSVRPKKGGPEREANAIAHGKFFDDDGRITKQDPSAGLTPSGKKIKLPVDEEKQKRNKKKHDDLYHS